MLKKKLNDIIYSDYLTPDEKEMYCYYYKGDSGHGLLWGKDWA